MEKYIKAIEENVCSICVDSTTEGNCTLNKNELCAVKYYLPKILEVVQGTDTDEIEKYKEQLADIVCKECRNEESEGNCYLREDANCSLDRYFSIIVETIKKVDKESV